MPVNTNAHIHGRMRLVARRFGEFSQKLHLDKAIEWSVSVFKMDVL